MQPLALAPNELGECARWIESSAEFWWVDILTGEAKRTANPRAQRPDVEVEAFAGELGFALPRSGGGFVAGVEQELWLVDPDGERRLLLELEEPPTNRFNDAICDRRGRLWAGTFARDRRPLAGFYRIDPDGTVERLLSGLTISNGVGWLAGGSRLHLIDSPAQRLECFDVDEDAGQLLNRRALALVDPADGAPDGLCVDREECSWVALFGGGAVRRYSPSGELVGELTLPVSHVTSPCLGGAAGDELFATTTRHWLLPQERLSAPLAGRVFWAEVDVAGTPVLPFGG